MAVPSSRAARPLRPPPRDEAVSDVVGSILLVGITVVLAAVMGGFVYAFQGPENTLHAELEIQVVSGDGTWANGDERVAVRHLGGEPLQDILTTIGIQAAGGVSTFSGASLQSAFAGDGLLSAGETWLSPSGLALNLAEDDAVDLSIVSGQDRPSVLLAAGTVSGLGFVGAGAGSCATDTSPPTVSGWQQAPANVQSTYVGTVTVTATLSDCTGVDPYVTPHLVWAVNPGASPSGDIAMSRPNPSILNVWRAVIPSQVWSLSATKTLQYTVGPLTDVAVPPNTAAASATRSDGIGPFTTYVASNVRTLGTVTNFANAQEATSTCPPGYCASEAALAEGLTGAAGSVTLLPNVPPALTGGTWAGASEVVASDNVYATTTGDGSTLRYSFGDQSGSPGSINSVVVRLEQDVCTLPPVCGAGINDGWTLRACYVSTYLAGICSATSALLPANAAGTDGTVQYDVTALRPGGGSWGWTDVNNLEVVVTAQKSGAVDGTWRADQLGLAVGYIPGYTMDIEFRWSEVQPGTQTLTLSYRTAVDTFSVQVYDPTANSGAGGFTTRGLPLSSAALVPWTYVLTGAEFNNGAPRIRFVDTTPAGATQGNLFLDYARVGTV